MPSSPRARRQPLRAASVTWPRTTSRPGALVLLAAIVAIATIAGRAAPAHAGRSAPPPPPPTPAAVVQRIVGEALTSDDAYDALGELCDRVGHRISGSPELDRAIAWAQARMRAAGLENVRAEPAMVPVWVRGPELARLVAPVERPLSILGLGLSVGTPAGGITADAVVVGSFEELGARGEAAIKGRIVVFDVPFTSYGETVAYRGGGATAAARLGAVAVLVRSIGPISYDTPHTGALFYREGPGGAPPIPAAAITIEDATALHRMVARGDRPRIHLELGGHRLPDAPSANVVGELTGRERPEEIVLLGAHLDSWDVGQGAQDDGAGVVEVMEAARLLRKLGLRPRRTLRVVLFTNEESGLAGGKAYRAAHQAELGRHVAVLESDSGAGPLQGFSVERRVPGEARAWPPAPPDAAAVARARALFDEVAPRLRQIAGYLEPLDATGVHPGHAGADLDPMLGEGVLGIGLEHDASHYFDVHHTRADTFDKIDRRAMRRNVAAITAFAYLVAELL